MYSKQNSGEGTIVGGSGIELAAPARARRTPLTSAQRRGFWAAWSGWTLDGMDAFIYALVLSPALTELLPKSGLSSAPADVAFCGSVLFALFLVGWAAAFVWGPLADRFGRTRTLAASVLVYSVFTGAAALAQNVWELAAFRLLAGVGIGGEWALAGTYVAEAWPEDRRKMGAGYLQTGYYAGFFLAATLNYTVGATFGWRAMFLCGLAPVILSLYIVFKVKEPERWQTAAAGETAAADAPRVSPLRAIFSPPYTRRTLVNAALLTVSIVGLWAGAVYEPTAIITLAKHAGMDQMHAARTASLGTGLLSIGTILGCLAAPVLCEMLGRRASLAIFFAGMAVCIGLSFGWAFYLPNGLTTFTILLFFLGFFGGNFAIYSLWLPEQYGTAVRATAFAFTTSFGRLVSAGVNFLLGWAIQQHGSLGMPVAGTAWAFLLGIALIPLALETRGERLPD
ncbi:MAG TPA: MFS transporter [Steroidobacteraceae bacterium]|nr:MFS transporter [Steroidobacteraceae bacterium]